MNSALAACAHAQHGPFTAGQARIAGYSHDEIRAHLRSGRWHRLRRGVYVEASRLAAVLDAPRAKHLLDCAAVSLALERAVTFSHWSAASYHRLSVWGKPPAGVFCTDSGESRSGRGYHVSGAVLPSEHTVMRDGWPMTTAGRTVVDLARAVPFEQGVVLVDSALRLHATSRAELAEVVLACSHYDGIGKATRVCRFADGGSESPLESASRVALVARGFPAPSLQCVIRDADGVIGRVDMYWEELRLVGEVDGKVKYVDPSPDKTRGPILWAEKLRQERLERAGLAVVRWSSSEILRSPDQVVERLHSAARRQRLWAPDDGSFSADRTTRSA